MNATDGTTISLSSTANFASFGAATIGTETIIYDGISGNNLLNVQRGQNGTTAAAHALGSSVAQSQYIIGSQGGVPSISAAKGLVNLYQVLLVSINTTYFVGGSNGLIGVILNFDGIHWTTAATGALGMTFNGMEINSNYGVAVGNDVLNNSYAAIYNGSTWVYQGLILILQNFYDVSCDKPSSPTNCWITGQSKAPPRALWYHSNTIYNTGVSNPNFIMSGVCCISGACISVGSIYYYLFPSNATGPDLIRNSLPIGILNDVDCPKANSCLIAVSNGSVYYYNGSTFTNYSISGSGLNAVSCPSTGNCMVVGNNGVMYNCALPMTSSASCTAQTSPGTLNLTDVHCNATNSCLAVSNTYGTIAYYFTNGVWRAVTMPANYSLNSVSGIMSSSGFSVTTIMNHYH
jgi:hypothetical protein